MPAVIILISSFQYDMSCHGRRPESIYITMDNGSQIQMDPPTLSETGKLDFWVDFPVGNVPYSIRVTVMNKFGQAHTEVMFGKLKQLL